MLFQAINVEEFWHNFDKNIPFLLQDLFNSPLYKEQRTKTKTSKMNDYGEEANSPILLLLFKKIF